MPIKSIFKTALFCALVSAGAGAFAQEEDMDNQKYRQMLQQAMKSGNYSQSQGQSWDARLKVVSGTVLVKTIQGDEWSKVTGEMPLDPNDVVKTTADGIAEIYLDDKGAIALGRNTELEITDLLQDDAVFSLNVGSLVAKIKHFLNEKIKLRVRTPAAVCAVRGTEFAVEYSQMSKESSIAVFDEGRLAVTQTGDSGKDAQEYLLEKNTEINFNPAQKRFRTAPLSRMGRHRGALGTMRTRLATLKGWKPKSLSKRAELRSQALKRKVIRRQLQDGKAKPKAMRGTKAVRGAKALRGAKAGKRAKTKRQAPAEEAE
ncbi:MAG: FecR family protein [Elusimicrobiota bacterium]|nr:FecR family protein [Elusimicrobiota bacterium]